jgi:hypothetical protein
MISIIRVMDISMVESKQIIGAMGLKIRDIKRM